MGKKSKSKNKSKSKSKNKIVRSQQMATVQKVAEPIIDTQLSVFTRIAPHLIYRHMDEDSAALGVVGRDWQLQEIKAYLRFQLAMEGPAASCMESSIKFIFDSAEFVSFPTENNNRYVGIPDLMLATAAD